MNNTDTWTAADLVAARAERDVFKAGEMAALETALSAQLETDRLRRKLDSIRAAAETVASIHANQISTHYPDCWKYHAACLAHLILATIHGDEVHT